MMRIRQKNKPKAKKSTGGSPGDPQKDLIMAGQTLAQRIVSCNLQLELQIQAGKQYNQENSLDSLPYEKACLQMKTLFAEAGTWLQLGLDANNLLTLFLIDPPPAKYELYVKQFFQEYQGYVSEIKTLLSSRAGLFYQIHLRLSLFNILIHLLRLFKKDTKFPDLLKATYPQLFNEQIQCIMEIHDLLNSLVETSNPLSWGIQAYLEQLVNNNSDCFVDYKQYIGHLPEKMQSFYDRFVTPPKTITTEFVMSQPLPGRIYVVFNSFFLQNQWMIGHTLKASDRFRFANYSDESAINQHQGNMRLFVNLSIDQIQGCNKIIGETQQYCNLHATLTKQDQDLSILVLYAEHLKEVSGRVLTRLQRRLRELDNWRSEFVQKLKAKQLAPETKSSVASNEASSHRNSGSIPDDDKHTKQKGGIFHPSNNESQPPEKSAVISELNKSCNTLLGNVDRFLENTPTTELSLTMLEQHHDKLKTAQAITQQTAKNYQLSDATVGFFYRKYQRAIIRLASMITIKKQIDIIPNIETETPKATEAHTTPSQVSTEKTKKKKKGTKGKNAQGKKEGKKLGKSITGTVTIPQDGSDDESDQAKEEARAKAAAKALEEKIRAEAEAKAKAEAKALEDKRKAMDKAKEEAKAKAEAKALEEKIRAEAEAKAKAEAKAREEAKAKAEAKAREEAKAKAEAKALEEKIRAEAEAKAKAEAKALEDKRKTEAKAKEEAKAKAEAKALEEKTRAEAEAKAKAEAKALEEKIRAEAEAKAKAEAKALEEKTRAAAEAKAKAEAKALEDRKRVGAETPPKVPLVFSEGSSSLGTSGRSSPETNSTSNASSAARTPMSQSTISSPGAQSHSSNDVPLDVPPLELTQITEEKKQKSESTTALLHAYRRFESMITVLYLQADEIIASTKHAGHFDWRIWDSVQNLYRQAYQLAKDSANDFLIRDTYKRCYNHLNFALTVGAEEINHLNYQLQCLLQTNDGNSVEALQSIVAHINAQSSSQGLILKEIQILEQEMRARKGCACPETGEAPTNKPK